MFQVCLFKDKDSTENKEKLPTTVKESRDFAPNNETTECHPYCNKKKVSTQKKNTTVKNI